MITKEIDKTPQQRYIDRRDRVECDLQRLNPTLTFAQIAQWFLDEFGDYGNPNPERTEDYIGYVNTPWQGDYFQTLLPKDLVDELIAKNVAGALMAGLSLVRSKLDELRPETGWPKIEWQETIKDEQNKDVVVNRSLGRIT